MKVLLVFVLILAMAILFFKKESFKVSWMYKVWNDLTSVIRIIRW